MPLPTRSARAVTALTAVLTVLMLTICAAWGTGAPARADDAGDAPEVAATMLVTSNEPVLDPAANSFEFSIRITNAGEAELPGGRLRLLIDPQRVEDETALEDPFETSGFEIAATDLDATAAEEEQSLTLTVRREDLPLALENRPGVYRIQAVLTAESDTSGAVDNGDIADLDITDPDTADRETEANMTPGETADADAVVEISGRAAIVWEGAMPVAEESEDPNSATTSPTPATPSVRVATVVPFLLPRDIDGMPTADQLGEAAPRLAELLDGAESAAATIAIDPRLIAGVRVLGDAAPPSARELLERLESTTLPGFLLQFADADPAAQAALGLTELLAPTDLAYITRYGGGEGSTEAPQATTDELLDWPRQHTPIAWPADGQVDSATLDLLSSAGISDVILTSENVTLTGGPRATLGSRNALIADTELGAASALATGGRTEIDRASGLASTGVLLALAAQQGSTDVVLALDRGATADAEAPAATLEALLALDWVEPIAVTAAREGTAELRASATLEDRRELLRSAVAGETEVTGVASLLQHPEDLEGYQRARLLTLFGARYAAEGANFSAVAERFDERDAELRQGVAGLSTEHTQLVGTSARVPVQLRNALPFDAIVNVQAAPASAALRVSEREFPDVAVPAEGHTSVLVAVNTRVSSGESALLVEVTDVAGEFTAYTDILPLTIRAGFEAIALWGLGIAAVLLLVFGTVRSIQRRRRIAGPASADPSPSSGDME